MLWLTWSFVLEEGVLLEEATEAGLLGASFFSPRALSSPFSGGEWAGLTRGVAGSWQQKQGLTTSSPPGLLPLTGEVASAVPDPAKLFCTDNAQQCRGRN